MYSVRQVDVVLNNRDRLLHKRPSTKKKHSITPTQHPEDTAEISPTLTSLSRAGMDIKDSYVFESSSKQRFYLEFKTDSFEKLVASGFYDSESKQVYITYEYLFQKEVNNKNETKIRSFSFTISYSLTEFEKSADANFEQNDEIISAMREILEFTEDINKHGSSPSEIVWTNRDLNLLPEIDKIKYMQKIDTLTNKILLLVELRKNLEANDTTSESKIDSETEKSEKVMYQENADIHNHFRLELKDISNI